MDEFAASRLPDLPTAGYSSPKQKATSDLVMFWLRNIERDRALLLEIVVAGVDKWRKAAGRAWGLSSGGRASAVTVELLDKVFEYMVRLAGPNPAQQLLILEGMAKEAQRTSWDKRKRTREALRLTNQEMLQELHKEQQRLGQGRKFFL